MSYSVLDQEALEWWFAQPLEWRLRVVQQHAPEQLWVLIFDRSGQFLRVATRALASFAKAFAEFAKALDVAFAPVYPTVVKTTQDEAAHHAHRLRSMKREDKSLPWNRR